MQPKPGLNILLNFHRITGTSYMCWNFDKSMTFIFKVLMISFNIVVFFGTTYLTYSTVLESIADNKDNLTSNSLLIFILYVIDYCGYSIQITIIIIILFVRGKRILQIHL